VNWYLAVLKNYAGFSGRARRTEYWMFFLFNFIISTVLNILYRSTGSNIFLIISLLYSLAVLIPGLAVAVRRLHDTNRSGWWIFIALIPFVGFIWLIVLFCLEGTRGSNQYGPDPKAAGAPATA
jgi:uncharacterized membrane protein YhaH (DUF805 family)